MSVAAPSRRLILAAVFSSCLGAGLIFGFQPPLIALTLSRLGYSSFDIGAVIAISTIAVVLCGPFYPRVIVRLGLKRCIVGGIVFAAGILLLMPLWPGVAPWLALRFAAGCALGSFDFRFPEEDWRSVHPTLASWFAEISKRPSFAATTPKA